MSFEAVMLMCVFIWMIMMSVIYLTSVKEDDIDD